ncbi:MoaD/ThiS family protein [Actinomycetospora chiangmaiensis]|uniref:MoaD/ThiS family protein n=1 Tax=Actinomycetospora chiangmaiensis TaxID=402650 RepID=UPI00036FBDD0|nr:MoaD/ThiS family protein [Actinomycetospora chiangmaiensis]
MTSSLETRTLTVTVRYFAGAKAAAGCGSEALTVPTGTTVAALVEAIASDHGEALVKVLAASSFLLDGTAVHSRDEVLADGAVVDVLPPFAGG